MTVKELKEKLNGLPDTMDVFIPSTLGDYDFGLVNSAMVQPIRFREDEESEPVYDDCFVLSED